MGVPIRNRFGLGRAIRTKCSSHKGRPNCVSQPQSGCVLLEVPVWKPCSRPPIERLVGQLVVHPRMEVAGCQGAAACTIWSRFVLPRRLPLGKLARGAQSAHASPSLRVSVSVLHNKSAPTECGHLLLEFPSLVSFARTLCVMESRAVRVLASSAAPSPGLACRWLRLQLQCRWQQTEGQQRQQQQQVQIERMLNVRSALVYHLPLAREILPRAPLLRYPVCVFVRASGSHCEGEGNSHTKRLVPAISPDQPVRFSILAWVCSVFCAGRFVARFVSESASDESLHATQTLGLVQFCFARITQQPPPSPTTTETSESRISW